ncbi:dnaJ homolog subfamily B member 14 [Chrysoperla carnea]|uniref:dnaJ homolog subfamily B member 14 n=1 Tax=Chrysoperla carnea TaxID=189513 RepID=UPI001D078686|nr:dnaJ homolog subfamily B member 14 [Chrysoperla carnea]
MLESNKDEADRCIEIAEINIKFGNREKAEKFLHKAERLYPSTKAKELLIKISSMKDHAKESPQVRRRQPAAAKAESTPVEFTPDQLEAVKRIKSCKDYYEILEVTKDATDSVIKKSYKKLALQLHPDKNKAPGAAEAFKAIGNAVAVLTDPEKRKQYDLFGSEASNMPNRASSQSASQHYSRGFEADITAEELFNMFFGGGFPQQNVYVRRGGRWARSGETNTSQSRHEQQNGYTAFVQMLPILILIILSMMSSLFISDPVYSLHATQKFIVQRHTEHLHIPYYVKETFHNEYQGSLKRLEATIEEEFITNLRHACHRERNYRETMIWKARNFGDEELFKKAQSIATPSCATLNELRPHHR